jgi:erythromycin esterase
VATPSLSSDQTAEVGFTLGEAHLAPPEPGSVEAALTDAGLGREITLTRGSVVTLDLRRSPRDTRRCRCSPGSGRRAPVYAAIPSAFDAVLAVPTVTRDRSVRL